MDHDERYSMNEEARREAAELFVPTGRAISCENCHGHLKGETILNEHVILMGIKIVVKRAVCGDCVEEVIAYRHRIRNVSEMTKELVASYDKAIDQKVWEQEYDKLPGRPKHI